MKCTLSIFLVIIFTFQLAQSQVTDTLTQKSQQESYDFYIQNQKKLKKTGWILLGAGAAAAVGGALIVNNNDLDEIGSGVIITTAGVVSMATSIPFFVISGSNKRKAEAIMETGKIGFGSNSFDNQKYVSVGLRINF